MELAGTANLMPVPMIVGEEFLVDRIVRAAVAQAHGAFTRGGRQ